MVHQENQDIDLEDVDLEDVIVVHQVNTNENDVLSEVVVEGVNVEELVVEELHTGAEETIPEKVDMETGANIDVERKFKCLNTICYAAFSGC